MKKFHLLLALALCLCMMTAFAESGPLTLNWEDVKALTEEDGSFWQLNDMAIQLWVPDELVYQEVSEEQLQSGIVALFSDESGHIVYAQYIETKAADAEELLAELSGGSAFQNLQVALVNGLKAVAFSDQAEDTAMLAIPAETGSALVIGCKGLQDPGFANTAAKVLGSVMEPPQ